MNAIHSFIHSLVKKSTPSFIPLINKIYKYKTTALVQNIHGPRELGVVFYLLILLISGIKLGVDFFTNE